MDGVRTCRACGQKFQRTLESFTHACEGETPEILSVETLWHRIEATREEALALLAQIDRLIPRFQ
jgi:hypothetical protein